ncbi:MAG: hypothetical protein M0R73_01145 [Dehalococcoidia bacterium]|nr:hypothetical protein [Dehalococcoidia bacterium]
MAGTPAQDDLTCAVCGEVAEASLWLSECFSCGRYFHLSPYNADSGMAGKDCGDAVLGESLGVETHCGDCIEAERRTAEAAVGPGRARAESMVRTLFGDELPLPPPSPPAPSERRPFRRVEDD